MSLDLACESPVPESIQKNILELLVLHVGQDNHSSDRSTSWEFLDTTEAKSAQQKVYILKVGKTETAPVGNSDPTLNGVTSPSSLASSLSVSISTSDWAHALESGGNKLVLRVWKGGSRWWNLNRNENPRILAEAEVEGYLVARLSFARTHETNPCDLPIIPRVLHFHPGSKSNESSSSLEEDPCWALLEYVGPNETDCLGVSMKYEKDKGNKESARCDQRSSSFRRTIMDRSYLEGMIKTRMEFGFEEPHPRWGRVPVNQSLEYAKVVLSEVLLPLHWSSQALFRQQQQQKTTKTYGDMVKVYREAWKNMTTSLSTNHFDAVERKRTHPKDPFGGEDCRLQECLGRLERALDLLETFDATVLPPLEPVLVHLDLQPQNLIFCELFQDSDQPARSCVFSVLDWEDAAWADPRFDLVLLCRKVCANQEQASVIWTEYERAMDNYCSQRSTRNTSISNERLAHVDSERPHKHSTPSFLLGHMNVWLRLETVHSITTMLLQSMDLVSGGRNPWETKKDLWGKLQREFTRLDGSVHDLKSI